MQSVKLKFNQIPSKQCRDFLREIKKRGKVKKIDLERILQLDMKNQEFCINHISKRRKKVLLKYLDDLPYMNENESINFELSRRESYQSYQSSAGMPFSQDIDQEEEEEQHNQLQY